MQSIRMGVTQLYYKFGLPDAYDEVSRMTEWPVPVAQKFKGGKNRK
jgi:hypothetical protein